MFIARCTECLPLSERLFSSLLYNLFKGFPQTWVKTLCANMSLYRIIDAASQKQENTILCVDLFGLLLHFF